MSLFPISQVPPGTHDTLKKGITWECLRPALSPIVLSVLRDELGYQSVTPVQAAVMPHFMQYKDVAVEAPTGSGKTISFVVPIIERLIKLDRPLDLTEVGALVLTPTRELAVQISQVFNKFITAISLHNVDDDPSLSPSSLPARSLSLARLIGGINISEDVPAIRENGCNIIVATPGRFLDIMKRHSIFTLRTLEVLVLDEADRLFTMGFKVTLSKIISNLPKQRRTGLFSATLNQDVNDMIRNMLRNPIMVRLQVKSSDSTRTISIPNTLQNYVIRTESDAKFSLLFHFLKHQAALKRVIVFFVTIASVIYFENILKCLRLPKTGKRSKQHQVDDSELMFDPSAYLPQNTQIHALHGRVSQGQRMKIYDIFSKPQPGILLTTDLCARGLDFDDVDWVIQVEPPQNPNYFLHRIGRTARVGKSGQAVMFLQPNEEAYVDLLYRLRVPIKDMPGFENVIVKAPNEDDQAHPICESVQSMINMTPILRKISCSDRSMVDKGTLAFISYVRAYKENHAQYIFRLKDLDYGKLAYLFGLVQLPRLSEFTPDKVQFDQCNIPLDQIKYKDVLQENKRCRQLQQIEDEKLAKRLEKRKKSKCVTQVSNAKTGPALASDKRQVKPPHVDYDIDGDDINDDEDILDDYRLMKRLDRDRTTLVEYTKATQCDEIDKEMKAKYAVDLNVEAKALPMPRKRSRR